MLYINRICLETSKIKHSQPTRREDLKGCTFYKSKPLEYQTKRDYLHEGTIYKGLEGLQLSLRGIYIIVGIDCGVWHLEDNDDKVQY